MLLLLSMKRGGLGVREAEEEKLLQNEQNTTSIHVSFPPSIFLHIEFSSWEPPQFKRLAFPNNFD